MKQYLFGYVIELKSGDLMYLTFDLDDLQTDTYKNVMNYPILEGAELIARRLASTKISKCGNQIFEGDILEMDKVRGVVKFYDDAFFLDYGEISEYLRYIDTLKFDKVGTIYDK
jgi:hypothetical protein